MMTTSLSRKTVTRMLATKVVMAPKRDATMREDTGDRYAAELDRPRELEQQSCPAILPD